MEKFIPFSKSLIRNIYADIDATHVFAVTPQERKIIEHRHSCFITSRSGTGKTTTMLFKMFGIERAHELHPEFPSKPRQMFVTKSWVLADKVEEMYAKLRQTLLTNVLSKDELLALARGKQDNQQKPILIAQEDQVYRADLPQRFSLLDDEHFPLFITFDKLCKLLENDISHHLASQSPTSPRSPLVVRRQNKGLNASGSLLGFSGSFIDFKLFKRDYWPHFSQHLTKGLSSILVFNEIMGVIKGSEEASRHQAHHLDRKAYEDLSDRTQRTFAKHRSRIYTIFEQYLKKKGEAGDYDAADRTYFILQLIERGHIHGHNIDYLYVDEAQDNLMVDALLLRFLCRNPDGLIWAGETAQAISVGCSFRFSDLKAFLYRTEERHYPSLHREQRETFQLTTNYRSRAGIVSCASHIIQIIRHFWPDSIDTLAPEKGVVAGEKPVFFSGWNEENALYKQFLSKDSSGNYMKFGARQCILVRNEAAREALRERVGKIGLIMTLYESKGFEFDDVLLWNFFEDSTIRLAQWRVVLNMLADKDPNIKAPRFNETLHAGICNELKFLYVAITRARNNAWIVDKSDKGEPMRQVWTAASQIQNCTPDTDMPRLAVSSSPEEWREQGEYLFRNGLWLQAMHCFDRANLSREAKVCKAYHSREEAKAIPMSDSITMQGERRNAFRAVAGAFKQCAGAKENQDTESRAYFRIAGEAFTEAEDYVAAAETYNLGQDYDNAAQLYRKANKFDEAMVLIKKHRSEMSDQVATSIVV